MRRPDEDEREVVHDVIDLETVLVGDNWEARGDPRSEDGAANVLAQLTVMNSPRVSSMTEWLHRLPPMM